MSNDVLQKHFDRAIALLQRKAEVAAEFAEWRTHVRNDGLDARAIYKIARDERRDAAQLRKAAEAAEAEQLYRSTLGLPLFDYCGGAAE